MVITAKYLVNNRRVTAFYVGMIASEIRVIRFPPGGNQAAKGRRFIPYRALKFSVDEGLATVVLNRPESGNLVDEEVAAELREVASEIAADSGARVVILTGNGPVFSTGRKAPRKSEDIRDLQASSAVAGIGVPVLVALNGDATDHGLELALAGDIRLAAADGNFGFSAPSAGGLPFDGGTQRLPRLVGPGWANDMLLTGRMVSAKEALTIGLVNRVAEPGEDVLGLARELAGQIMEGSPIGARYAKEAVNSGSDLTLNQGLVLEADLNVILQSTSDRAEGIASFLERRSPSFKGE